MAHAMMTKLLMCIIATTMLIKLALAVDHNVGAPNGGWDTSTDLKSWASTQTFTIGDNIVFRYTPNHNVFEVSKDNYDSCSTSSAISTDALSPTTIPLSDAGSRYFICGTPGHCGQGMKVEIKTKSTTTTSPPPTTTTPTSPTPPQSTPSPPPPQSTPSPPTSSSLDTPPSSSPATPPLSSPNTPPPPTSITHGTPAPIQPSPSPSSSETIKMSVVSLVCLGFLMMIYDGVSFVLLL